MCRRAGSVREWGRCATGEGSARAGERSPMESTEEAARLDRAADALVSYSGCTKARADVIVAAVRDVAIEAALGTISGEEPVATSVTDQRVARLRALTGR